MGEAELKGAWQVLRTLPPKAQARVIGLFADGAVRDLLAVAPSNEDGDDLDVDVLMAVGNEAAHRGILG